MKNSEIIYVIDPRIKIISTFFFILIVVIGNQNILRFSALFAILLFIDIVSRVPISFLFKKSLSIIPFVVLVTMFLPFSSGGERIEVAGIQLSISGLRRFEDVVMKAFLSVFCAATLVGTTEFPYLLKGLEKLKMPKIMVILLSFIYRYCSVIQEEATRMKMARDVRSKGGNLSWQLKTLGNILGQLFIRSYERSERIYEAMVLRGFTGTMKTLNQVQLASRDVVCGLSFCILVTVIRVIL